MCKNIFILVLPSFSLNWSGTLGCYRLALGPIFRTSAQAQLSMVVSSARMSHVCSSSLSLLSPHRCHFLPCPALFVDWQLLRSPQPPAEDASVALVTHFQMGSVRRLHFAGWPPLSLSQVGLTGCQRGGCWASRNQSWVLTSLVVGRASLLKRVLVLWAW